MYIGFLSIVYSAGISDKTGTEPKSMMKSCSIFF